MRITDNVYQYFISNFLIPRIEDYSHPGYIYTKLTDDSDMIMLRDVFIPEETIVNLEKKTLEKYGDLGRQELYKIGKISGYTYAKYSRLKTVDDFENQNDFEKYMRLLMLFIGGTYGADVEYDIDIDKKTIEQSYSDFVVCPLNGIGELVINGSASGIWSWLQKDKSIEGLHIACVGRGDKMCKVVLAPFCVLSKKYDCVVVFNEFNTPELTDYYLRYNSLQPTEEVKYSLEKLIESGVVQFKKGKVIFQDNRFFEWDVHYIYYLEILYKDKKLLFDTIKNSFIKIGYSIGEKLNESYISEFLGALGWGDITILDNKVLMKYYPYTELYPKTSFIFVKAMLSGLLTILRNKDINIESHEVDMSENFNLILSW